MSLDGMKHIGGNVLTVDDGNDLSAIDRALTTAVSEPDLPSLIKIRTHIGFGSPGKQDSAEAHGSPLGEDEVARTKQRYGWDPANHFVVPDAALERFRQEQTRGAMGEQQWNALVERYAVAHPDLARAFRRASARALPDDWATLWNDSSPVFDVSTPMATREASGKLLGQSNE